AGQRHGPAIEVVARGRGRRRRVHDRVGVVAFDTNQLQWQVEFAGGDLGDLRVQALTHFHAAVNDLDGAIRFVDAHQGRGRIEGRQLLEADAVLERDHGDAALAPTMGAVERLDLVGPAGEFTRLVEAVPLLANVAEPEGL